MITPEQLIQYDRIKILILGEKATSYTIDEKLTDKCSFEKASDIVDFDNLLKDIMVADIEVLDSLYSLFQKEFKQIKIELEPMDKNGDFESSLDNNLEQIPNKKPINAKKLADLIDGDFSGSHEISFEKIIELYEKLSKIPRITRELISIIVDRGEYKVFSQMDRQFGILPLTLKHITRYTKQELELEMIILINAGLVYIGQDLVDEDLIDFFVLNGLLINELIMSAKSEKINLKTLFNTMNWTIFDS